MPTVPMEFTTVEIEVTQEDINSGIRKSCIDCPIALAVKRKFPNLKVWIGGINESLSLNTFWIPLPENAKRFIREFDIGALVIRTLIPSEEMWQLNATEVPFKFSIDVPSHFLKV